MPGVASEAQGGCSPVQAVHACVCTHACQCTCKQRRSWWGGGCEALACYFAASEVVGGSKEERCPPHSDKQPCSAEKPP